MLLRSDIHAPLRSRFPSFTLGKLFMRLRRPHRDFSLTVIVVCVETQVSFDQDWANNSITYADWFDNATSAGVIAYKLLSQNDSSDKIDSSKVSSD